MLNRRTLIAGLGTGIAAGFGAGSLAGCATAEPADPAGQSGFGLETPSESVHSGVASLDGRYRLTTRLCRYPERREAWLWVHALTPEGFFSFVEHIAPCDSNVTPETGELARYADARELLVFTRHGAVSAPTSATVAGRVRAHRTADSVYGPGSHRLSFDIRFTPQRIYSGLLANRTEVFGRSTVELEIGGVRHSFEGPAQFHEQRQSNPRFTAPFAYITLWGEGAAAGTLLAAPRRADGYLIEGETSTNGRILHLDPAGPASRRLVVELEGGRRLEGRSELQQAFTIPIYGVTWRGHMVRMTLGGERYFGHINDFAPAPIAYPQES